MIKSTAMLPSPEFAEVPARKPWRFQYSIYFIVVLIFSAVVLLESSGLAFVLLVIPGSLIGLALWLRHRAHLWHGEGAPQYPDRKYYFRIRLGWSRTSNPQYAGRGTTVVPHGPFGGGAIYDGGSGSMVTFGAFMIVFSFLYLLIAPLGIPFALAFWLKRQFSRPLLTSLLH